MIDTDTTKMARKKTAAKEVAVAAAAAAVKAVADYSDSGEKQKQPVDPGREVATWQRTLVAVSRAADAVVDAILWI
jgi:hypothetical protein